MPAAAAPRPTAPSRSVGLPPPRGAQLSQPTAGAPPAAEALRKSNGNGAAAALAYSSQPDEAPLYDEDEHTVVAPVGGLASAFSQSLGGSEAAPLSTLSTPADEWYVGINGVPVGPIRLSELRSKASAGNISLDSLVWRDGFEEWMPLRTFPELVAIVEEGVSSARASLTPLSPPWTSSQPPPPAQPLASQPEVYDPFKVPGGAAGTPLPRPADLSDPFGAPGAGFGAAGAGPGVISPPHVDIDEGVIPKRSGTPLLAWVAVVVALVFGLGVGFVMFDRGPGETVIKYVEVTKTGEVPVAGSAPIGTPENPTEEGADAGSKGQSPRTGGGPIAKAGPATDKTPEKGLNLKGLGGVTGPGPAGGPGTGPGGNANSALDSTAIQKTVSRYTSSVKRSCWQPALDGRSKDAPSSARVNVTITVSPSGSVSGVSTSGDPKGYRGLAGCIQSRVRGWQFPASNGTTTVNVPFVFAAQ